MKIKRNLLLIISFAAVLLVSGCSKQMLVLVEKDEIVDTLNRLFINMDNLQWDEVKELFTGEVMFSMGGEPVRQKSSAIIAAWDKGLKRLKAVHHLAGNYRVTVSGTEADAFCYGIASHYQPNASGRNTRTFVGSYDFHLVKTGGVWKIDSFRFNLKYIEGNKSL